MIKPMVPLKCSQNSMKQIAFQQVSSEQKSAEGIGRRGGNLLAINFGLGGAVKEQAYIYRISQENF
jgi:hypothetical protein